MEMVSKAASGIGLALFLAGCSGTGSTQPSNPPSPPPDAPVNYPTPPMPHSPLQYTGIAVDPAGTSPVNGASYDALADSIRVTVDGQTYEIANQNVEFSNGQIRHWTYGSQSGDDVERGAHLFGGFGVSAVAVLDHQDNSATFFVRDTANVRPDMNNVRSPNEVARYEGMWIVATGADNVANGMLDADVDFSNSSIEMRFLDPERGREEAMTQFLDEKTYRPGYGAYERDGASSPERGA